MSGKYTAAQKAATEKYQKTLANISIRIKREEYTRIKAAAENAGYTLRDFVLSAVNEKIERDKNK